MQATVTPEDVEFICHWFQDRFSNSFSFSNLCGMAQAGANDFLTKMMKRHASVEAGLNSHEYRVLSQLLPFQRVPVPPSAWDNLSKWEEHVAAWRRLLKAKYELAVAL